MLMTFGANKHRGDKYSLHDYSLTEGDQMSGGSQPFHDSLRLVNKLVGR